MADDLNPITARATGGAPPGAAATAAPAFSEGIRHDLPFEEYLAVKALYAFCEGLSEPKP